jgi:hypothetical protein
VTRGNKILAGLLAVQLVLAIVMLTRDRGGGLAAPAPLTAGLDAKAVTRVQIFAKRDKTATGDDKPALDLAKKGDAWVMASGFDYPVDATKIDTLVGNLARLQSRGPITTSAARHGQLGVADGGYERKLIITTAKGDQVFLVGGPAGAQRTAVRVGTGAAVHAVPSKDLSAWSIDTQAKGWVTGSYLEVPKDEVVAVTVKTAKGTVELDRSTGSWLVTENGAPYQLGAGESINTLAIDTAVAKATRLELAAPGDPARDAASPTATITIRSKPPAPAPAPTSDGDAGVEAAPPAPASVPDRVIDVVADGERYWVRERGNPRAVLVDKLALDDVVQLGRDKLVSTTPPKGAPLPGAAQPPGPGQPPMDIPGMPSPG